MVEILVNQQGNSFHLKNDTISYVIKVEEFGLVSQQYVGQVIDGYATGRNYPRKDRSFSPNFYGATDRLYSKDTLPQEYSSYGSGDFRTPAVRLKQGTGSTVVDFRYDGYEVVNGKNSLEGLPHFYSQLAKTLKLKLTDKAIPGVELYLYYSIFPEGGLVRSAKLINNGPTAIIIEKLDSLQLDMPESNYDVISLPGAWANERQLKREPLGVGRRVFASSRGSSSHQQNPFAALLPKETTEHQGDVFGFSLVYSGSFQLTFETDQYESLRVNLGLNEQQFSWELESGAAFQSPEAILVYSKEGLNGMSKIFHAMTKGCLLRGQYKEKERPILVNNWEATYFDFNERVVKQLLDQAADLGIELFVLDDGWFGKRNDDRTSLGDWDINYQKLPNGLEPMIAYGKERQVAFGLWFEPEMISEASELFRSHPEWVLQVPGREKSRSRDQFVLDFSRQDVREHLYQKMQKILFENDIRYVKWDMNRHLSEVYSADLSPNNQGETHHRYVLGLYDFLEKLTEEFPNVLFESCSGGGGRFDLGMLYYMPQTWNSDNTDAVARLKIQYATSLLYPVVTMGAHVSDVPNHQTHRITSMEMRGNVAMSGTLGYELDLNAMSDPEKVAVREQINFYKEHRQLIQFGDFYRLMSPFEGNECAWIFVNPDQSDCLVFYYHILEQASAPFRLLKLAGLSEAAHYSHPELGTFSGSELMHAGFYTSVTKTGDFRSDCYYFKRVEESK